MTTYAKLLQACCNCEAGTVVEILGTDREAGATEVKTPNGSVLFVISDALECIPAELSPTLWGRLLGDSPV